MRTLMAAALATLVLLSGCGSESGDQETTGTDKSPSPSASLTVDGRDAAENLSNALALWDENGPEDYTWTVERVCYCPPLKLRIDVADGSATGTESLGGKGADRSVSARTMEDLFDEIEKELGEAHSVKVSYDPTTGAVKKVAVDRIENAVDDEYSYVVTDLQPAQ